MVNGKSKGSAFERHICKQLSLWVSGGKHSDFYWRSAMSGGRATVSAKSGVMLRRQAGDITATAPEAHALTDHSFIECKHVRDLQIDSFLIKGTGVLANFWRTATQEAEKHEREPLIIARQNRFPDIVIGAQPTFEFLIGSVWTPYCSLETNDDNVEIRWLSDLLKIPFMGGRQ